MRLIIFSRTQLAAVTGFQNNGFTYALPVFVIFFVIDWQMIIFN